MIKITDTKDLKLDKLRKGQKTSASSGAAFADLVQAASGEVAAPTAPATVHDITTINPQLLQDLADLVPKQGRERGHYILDILAELQQDILAGQGTTALHRLQVALRQQAVDWADLPPRLREILTEIDLRAALEVAKLTPVDAAADEA